MRHPLNGWGHPGWEGPHVPINGRGEPVATQDYDEDSAIVHVTEPGVYRVRWDVATNRFKLEPVELPF